MSIWWLYAATLIAVFVSLFKVLLLLPLEATQGAVQKIFFFHVPSAFCMYAGVIVGAALAAVYLFDRKRARKWDQLSRASLTTATIFAGVVLTSGPVWAKPIWGVYWTWDPRLTTTFTVFILLLGYHFVRAIFRKTAEDKGALIGAILAILALLDIPLIHFSVKLWRGIHPSVLRNPEGLPAEYVLGLELMTLAFFLYATLLTIILFRFFRISERRSARG